MIVGSCRPVERIAVVPGAVACVYVTDFECVHAHYDTLEQDELAEEGELHDTCRDNMQTNSSHILPAIVTKCWNAVLSDSFPGL
jgi:hypothetical protein